MKIYPVPEQVFPAPEYDISNVPCADAWFWQVGNRWVAVVEAHEIETWWDGVSDEEIAGYNRPDPWHVPIDNIPTTGTLVYSVKVQNTFRVIERQVANL